MRSAIALFVVLLLGCAQEPSATAADEGQAVRWLVTGDELSCFLSDDTLSDAELATIRDGGKLGRPWVWIEMPAHSPPAEYDLSTAASVTFADEFATIHPITNAVTTARITLVGAEPGLSGFVATSAVDGSSDYRIAYSVRFQGSKPLFGDTLQPIDFDSHNDSRPVPER